MDYKLVAIDLDDTLLNEDRVISQRSKNIIKESILKGVLVTFATGRMFKSALPYALEIGLTIPLITYQGALVKYADGREISHLPLSLDLAKDVVNFIRPKGIHMNLYYSDDLYVFEVNKWAEHYAKMTQVPINILNSLEEKPIAPTKIVLMGDSNELEGLNEGLKAEFGGHTNLTRSKPHLLEISHPEATKGMALKRLAESMNIKREQVIAIGDELNDLDMIEYAGCGVAIGNACDELKQVADIITLSNEDDGVAAILEKLILPL
ncbi:hypothetical protein SAMN00017405_1646 [Desulfonispora thiosulfatigenes DSM 11270]|uniref:Cof subfamily of IIB subfamily of haloacid dehalogenase superfamily/HAD-superfamily hydrolase, subfamily IIB n=1 Tax=Desulfonispora thiosulfatigenes DSM 11270 TaxID=656914 RepID=A0A1W1UWX9_DESTI|nr:Cof-type HAD-IIB family hydrolase [Desulfonispora thiosulfatigenes]SMB85509.1 hypothetical protein SAMN00017405_1646 [Desulfonispora thiosulfatigenes DSM 11270]